MFTLTPSQYKSLALLWSFEEDVLGVHEDFCDELREFYCITD